MVVVLWPGIEPNKWWARIDGVLYYGSAGNDTLYSYLGEPTKIDKTLEYNEIDRRVGESVTSVMHRLGGQVLIWHYPIAGRNWWSLPKTADMRLWVDSHGYRRIGTVDIDRIGGSFLAVHQYTIERERSGETVRMDVADVIQ